ncbi:histidine kinase [Paraglaciecola aquimarina]|uniref:Histidine kinase n=1 Tax=Paraglaciecola algarum TaxID=3050085 RepID=A0ABS9D879_9ALTE|nr:histidine kinase [Paraglaciecola sp. G1-23]MCF2949086.1 histidine kinase [Paraglaciecola sp. G1-23]
MLTPYWRYQIIGWFTLLTLDFSGKYAAKMMIPSLLLAVLILYSLGLLVSHGMRYIFKQYCAQLTIAKLIPVAFLVSFVGAFLSSSGMMLLLYLSGHQAFTDDKVNAMQIYQYNIFMMWLFLSIWTGLYLFVTRQRQVDDLNQKQQALQDNLQQSQLHALMNQLNPHFMFNSINNIRALILEDKHKARDMLAHMADMLRYNLKDQDKALEALSKELEIANAFMALASIQFEDRLTFVVELDDNIDQDILIPRMLLQLLLENAIKHGIAKRMQGGEVKLKIKLLTNNISIEVTNHGQLVTGSKPQDTKIGLQNIQSRLAMLYDNEASFEIKQVNELVLARILIPKG